MLDKYVRQSRDTLVYIFFFTLVCPLGFTRDLVIHNGNMAKCPGVGVCCGTMYTSECPESCAKSRCITNGGTWVLVDKSENPYTCEMGYLLYCIRQKSYL